MLKAGWQGRELIARQHQLLHLGACAQRVRQRLQLIIRKNQPAQGGGGQRFWRHAVELIMLKTYHAQAFALPQHTRKLRKLIGRAE